MWAKSCSRGHDRACPGPYCARVAHLGAPRRRASLPEHCIVVIARDRQVGTNLADDLEAGNFSVLGPTPGHDGVTAAVEQLRSGVAVVAVVADHDASVVTDACGALASLPGLEVVAVGDYPGPETVAQILDAGAADVVSSRCDLVEQQARIRRCLLRATHDVAPVLVVGAFTVDVASRTVAREGEPVKLTRTEFDLFLALARRSGRVVSAADLLRACLGYDHADPHVLTVHIQRLRSKVEPDPARPRHITSVRGVGYIFSAG